MRSRRFRAFLDFAPAFESPEALPAGSPFAPGDKLPRRPETVTGERALPDRCTENHWRMPIGRRVFSDAGAANFLIAAWNPNLRDSCQQAIHNSEPSDRPESALFCRVHFKRPLFGSIGDGGEAKLGLTEGRDRIT